MSASKAMIEIMNAEELLRRLTQLDAHLAESVEFERQWPLELGAPAARREVESVEAELGIPLPEPFRSFYLRHASSGRLCFALQQQHHDEFEADDGGVGGFILLSPEDMRSEHQRILCFTEPEAPPAFVPLVKDHSSATWLCALETPRGVRIARVVHDEALEDAELWPVETFFDGWSRAGFPVDTRWEDVSEPLLSRYASALDLCEP